MKAIWQCRFRIGIRIGDRHGKIQSFYKNQICSKLILPKKSTYVAQLNGKMVILTKMFHIFLQIWLQYTIFNRNGMIFCIYFTRRLKFHTSIINMFVHFSIFDWGLGLVFAIGYYDWRILIDE